MAAGFLFPAYGQKTVRENLRRGNKQFRDSAFEAAETYYRKVVDASPQSMEGHYNLAGSLMFQNKAQESMQELETASKMTEDKDELHKIYHNAGVLLQSAKEYKKAIEAYKESLRNDPKDDETRYNLALCQKLLKDQEQQQQDQQQEQQEQQQQQQQQQQQPQPEQQDDEQMSQDNAEQLLRSVMQDEKDVQDKVKKQQVLKGRQLDKDW